MVTKRKEGQFDNFNEFEQAAICLTAMVVRQGGKVIISNKELNPDIGDKIVDIFYLENGDVHIELIALPGTPQEGDLRYNRNPLEHPMPEDQI